MNSFTIKNNIILIYDMRSNRPQTSRQRKISRCNDSVPRTINKNPDQNIA